MSRISSGIDDIHVEADNDSNSAQTRRVRNSNNHHRTSGNSNDSQRERRPAASPSVVVSSVVTTTTSDMTIRGDLSTTTGRSVILPKESEAVAPCTVSAVPITPAGSTNTANQKERSTTTSTPARATISGDSHNNKNSATPTLPPRNLIISRNEKGEPIVLRAVPSTMTSESKDGSSSPTGKSVVMTTDTSSSSSSSPMTPPRNSDGIVVATCSTPPPRPPARSYPGTGGQTTDDRPSSTSVASSSSSMSTVSASSHNENTSTTTMHDEVIQQQNQVTLSSQSASSKRNIRKTSTGTESLSDTDSTMASDTAILIPRAPTTTILSPHNGMTRSAPHWQPPCDTTPSTTSVSSEHVDSSSSSSRFSRNTTDDSMYETITTCDTLSAVHATAQRRQRQKSNLVDYLASILIVAVLAGAVLAGICVSDACWKSDSSNPAAPSSPNELPPAMAVNSTASSYHQSPPMTITVNTTTNAPAVHFATPKPTLRPTPAPIPTVTQAPTQNANSASTPPTRGPSAMPTATLMPSIHTLIPTDTATATPTPHLLHSPTANVTVTAPSASTRVPTQQPLSRAATGPPSNSTQRPIGGTHAPISAKAARAQAIVSYINNITVAGRNIVYRQTASADEDRLPIHERALKWLIEDDPLQLVPDTPLRRFRMRQRYALRTMFVQQQNDANRIWKNVSGWVDNTDECMWFGVKCKQQQVTNETYSRNAVIQVALDNNNVRGVLVADLGLLSTLNTFRVARNKIRGTLPASLSHWTNLSYLDLNTNQFTGTLPLGVGNWKELRTLYLMNNSFNGSLPATMDQWSDMQFMDLGPNSFTGTIPVSIGTTWTDLVVGSFDANEFTGSIPIGLCKIKDVIIDADCASDLNCSCCNLCY